MISSSSAECKDGDARKPLNVDADMWIVRKDGTRLRTVRTGTGPAVILVHGFAGSVNVWNLVQPRLIDRGYCVVAYDQRGHGRSTIGRDGLSSEALRRDFAAVMSEHKLHDAIVVCHSMANFVCLGALGRDRTLQQRVRGVVCAAPVTGRAAKGARVQIGLIRFGLMQRLAAIAPLGRALTKMVLGPAARFDVIEAARLDTVHTPRHLVDLAKVLLVESIDEVLPAIDAPVRILADSRTPQWHSDLIHQHALRATLTHVSAGHMLNWEDPQSIVEEVVQLSGDAQ